MEAIKAIPDGIRLSHWWEQNGVTRSTAYALLAIAEVKPEPRRLPGGGKPVSWLSPDDMQRLEPLVDRLKAGESLAQLSQTTQNSTGLSRTPSQTIQDGFDLSGIVPWLPPTPSDPLAIPRALLDASQLGWISTSELAAVLGLAPSTLRSWQNGRPPRPGYRLEKRKDGAAVWWKVCVVPSDPG